jgi:hypothetical protein
MKACFHIPSAPSIVVFIAILILSIEAFRVKAADTNLFINNSTIDAYFTNYLKVEITARDENIFASFRNITPVVGETAFRTGDIDFAHPTNVEIELYHEPVVTKTTNGTWVVHFKDETSKTNR